VVRMRMTFRSWLAVAPFLVLQAGAAFAQPAPTVTVTTLADRFYRLTSTVPYPTNLLAYVSPAGILLVDSGSIETGDELKRVLKTLDGGPADVKILINTHAHIDHTGGNLALAGGPLIIGPEILRSTLRAYGYVLYEFPDNALPSITFTDSMTIRFGDETVRIIAMPGSHDATDVIVYFTKAGIVCMGDIAYGMMFPSIDPFTGNLLEYPNIIDKVLAAIPDTATIISGHGRDTSVKELRQFRDMLAGTAAVVKAGLAQGKDVATMQKEDVLKQWASFGNPYTGSGNDWIPKLAAAGPSRLRGAVIGELYPVLVRADADAAIARYAEMKRDHPTGYPFNPDGLIRLGAWLSKKGRPAEAVKLFELAVREFPTYPPAYAALGPACEKAGDAARAIWSYQEWLRVDPASDEAKEALKRVRK